MRCALPTLAILVSCSRAPSIEAPAPDPSTRARTYLARDPKPVLDRMRQNAASVGCRVEERSNGTLLACGDVDLWIVPDANGMEITCTGLPLNCSQRGRQLLRDDADAGQ